MSGPRIFNFIAILLFIYIYPGWSQTIASCDNICALDGSSASFAWDTTTDDDFVIVKTNQCAAHETENGVGGNPNMACRVAERVEFYIPKVPVYRDSTSGINDNHLYVEGSISISLSGVIMYGPAIGPNGGDAGSAEIDTFDYCGSHADPDGILHYHIEPYCITEVVSAMETGTVMNPTAEHSILYGWSPDGFPIYGPNGDDGEQPSDLDECQGHASDSGAGGGYHYHYTGPLGPFPQDENTVGGYPYFMGCFKGCVPDDTVNAADLQMETYAECLASASDAADGSYASEFFESFTELDFSGIDFVLSDATSAPTVAEAELKSYSSISTNSGGYYTKASDEQNAFAYLDTIYYEMSLLVDVTGTVTIDSFEVSDGDDTYTLPKSLGSDSTRYSFGSPTGIIVIKTFDGSSLIFKQLVHGTSFPNFSSGSDYTATLTVTSSSGETFVASKSIIASSTSNEATDDAMVMKTPKVVNVVILSAALFFLTY